METSSLDRIIVERIADLDAATNRMWQIQAKVAEAIDETKRKWAEDNAWSCCDRSWAEEWECSVYKPEWHSTGDEWKGWFQLDWRHGYDGPGVVGTEAFWLTRLCNEGSSTLGFRFFQEVAGKPSWKQFLRQKSEWLQGTRFIFDDAPSFFLPFSIDTAALATAVEEEDYSSCLEPMIIALDHVRDNVERFEELLAHFSEEVP